MDTKYMSAGKNNQYPYFIGMKVEVGIPMSDNKTFRDWAIINEIDEDLLSLQLSRDILPSGVSLRVGQILTIRGEVDFQIFVCRAYIVSKSFDQDLLLRLTGEVVSNELREFFRIDAFLPIKFYRLHDQNPVNVQKLWEGQRKQRQEEERARERRRLEAKKEKMRAMELAREQGLLDNVASWQQVGFSLEKSRVEKEDNEYYESWNTVTSVAVNISGGGLKISTNQKFETNELILLEIFVPSSRCIVDVVARVIFSSRDDVEGERQNWFNTGLQFIFIDESARSAISNHISSIQLQRIRQFKGFTDVVPMGVGSKSIADRHYAYLDTLGGNEIAGSPERVNRWKITKQLGLALLLILIGYLLYTYFSEYVSRHPKNTIQYMFESGIRKLRGNR